MDPYELIDNAENYISTFEKENGPQQKRKRYDVPDVLRLQRWRSAETWSEQDAHFNVGDPVYAPFPGENPTVERKHNGPAMRSIRPKFDLLCPACLTLMIALLQSE